MILIEHTGDEPVTLEEVKSHCRVFHGGDDALLAGVIIPGARALAESRTGCAICEGAYEDLIIIGDALSLGGVITVESVEIDDVSVSFSTTKKGRRTVVLSPGNEGKSAVVRFTAGIDIGLFPGVKSWILLACGWMYEHRELVSTGTVTEMPRTYVDALLSPINLPDPF